MRDAKVFDVVIASPSDVEKERRLVEQTIWRWNAIHSETAGCVLMPHGWDTSVATDLSAGPAQTTINKAIVDRADILIGLFWSRLGSPTLNAESGTAEEIRRHINAKKPAIVFFKEAGFPHNVDIDQLDALRKFRKSLEPLGLIDSFKTDEELRSDLPNQLSLLLQQNEYLRNTLARSQLDTVASFEDILQRSTSPDAVDSIGTKLLMAAAKLNGSIIIAELLSGWQLKAGYWTDDGSYSEARKLAEYKRAIRKMESQGLVEITQDHNKTILAELTADGWDIAELL